MLLNERKYDELEKSINNHILSYKYQLEILNNLKLLTKKDGAPYKKPLNMFDIEALKNYFSKKYNFKFGAGSSLYLSDSEYDYIINCHFNGLDVTCYITKKIYLDEVDEKTRKEKEYKSVFHGGFIRDYYNIDTPDELKEIIEKKKNNIIAFLSKEEEKRKALKKLKKDTISYLSKINDNLFYRSEIASIIDF